MLIFSDIQFFKVSDPSNTTEVLVEYDETKIQSNSESETLSNNEMIYNLAAIAALAFVALISFKNRKLQVSLTSFNFVAILLLIALMYYYSFAKSYVDGTSGELSFFALMPLGLLFFNFLALKGIRKDIHLIRSMDRFR